MLNVLRNKSVRLKLILIVMSTVSLALVIVSAGFILKSRKDARADLLKEGLTFAEIIATNSAGILSFGSEAEAEQLLESLKPRPGIEEVMILRRDGSLFAEYLRDGAERWAQDEFEEFITDSVDIVFCEECLTISQPISSDNEEIGRLILRTGLDDLKARSGSLIALSVMGLLVALLISLVLIWSMQGVITRPIFRLAELTRAIATGGDYTQRAEVETEDELGSLTESFNQMLEEIAVRDIHITDARDRLEVHVEERTSELVDEVIERQRVEERLRETLGEKESLLKEVHHRVKNNMQVITSLLNLHSDSINDTEAKQVFDECQTKVKSMALIHETLYQSDDLAVIDLATYVENLTRLLQNPYGSNRSDIRFKTDLESVFVGIDAAVPAGLIVNEIITNASKYAFPDGKPGEVTITLHCSPENVVSLVIHDNGVGLPEGFDVDECDSLGLQLVSSLAMQLGGTANLETDNGTKVTLEFAVQNDTTEKLEHVSA